MIPEKKIEDPQLSLLVSQIVKLVSPKKIYLFGSRATGKFQESSDYDLLIVMPDGTHRRKTAQLLYEKISSVNIPYDILVTTEDSLMRNSQKPGLIYRQALKNGTEIYAARR
jgi:predicted nucleotidyltransferase